MIYLSVHMGIHPPLSIIRVCVCVSTYTCWLSLLEHGTSVIIITAFTTCVIIIMLISQ